MPPLCALCLVSESRSAVVTTRVLRKDCAFFLGAVMSQTRTVLCNAEIFTGTGKVTGFVEIVNGHIHSVSATQPALDGAVVRDLSGLCIAPALIDLQVKLPRLTEGLWWIWLLI